MKTCNSFKLSNKFLKLFKPKNTSFMQQKIRGATQKGELMLTETLFFCYIHMYQLCLVVSKNNKDMMDESGWGT